MPSGFTVNGHQRPAPERGSSQPGLVRQQRWRLLVHDPAARALARYIAEACRYVRREPVAHVQRSRRGEPERGVVGGMDAASPEVPALTAALDMPSAHVLADQASII